MGTYWHMSSQLTTTCRGCRYVSNHWPHGGIWIQGDTLGHNEYGLRVYRYISNHWLYWGTWAHADTCVHNIYQVLEVTAVSWIIGQMVHRDTCRHKSSKWTTSLRCYMCVSNNWPHWGTWAHADTWVHNIYQVFEATAVSQIIGHIGAHRHMQTHSLTTTNQSQVW